MSKNQHQKNDPFYRKDHFIKIVAKRKKYKKNSEAIQKLLAIEINFKIHYPSY